MSDIQTISCKPDGKVWRVTFNGRILGDSLGYGSRAEASAAALAIVEEDHRLARRDFRPVTRIYRPYF